MHWLKDLIGKLLVKAGLGEGRFPGEFLHFFLYDIIKNFCAACGADLCDILYSKAIFPPERKQKDYGKISWNLGESDRSTSRNSDSVLLLLIDSDLYGFISAGLPLGVTFSFLISSPMVDLGSLILLMSVFGGKIAFAYVIVGLVIAVIGERSLSGCMWKTR